MKITAKLNNKKGQTPFSTGQFNPVTRKGDT